MFLFAQFLQTSLGYSPLETGLRLMPWTITFILIAPAAGALADRIGERPLMVTGLALQAVGLTWLALTVDAGDVYSELLAPFVVGGIGISMAIPAGQNSVVGGFARGRPGQGRRRQLDDARARRRVRDELPFIHLDRLALVLVLDDAAVAKAHLLEHAAARRAVDGVWAMTRRGTLTRGRNRRQDCASRVAPSLL